MSKVLTSTRRPLLSRVIVWVVRGLLVAIVAVYLHFYICQEYWLLEPNRDPTDYQARRELTPTFNGWLSPSNGVLLSLDESSSSADVVINIQKFRTGSKPAQGVVVYFHGNRGNLYKCRWEIEPFLAAGYDVWAMDYRRFGQSTGPLDEAALLDDALMFYQHVVADADVDEKNIVVWGRSFGSGIAAYVASKNSPKLLVLETPYCSIPDAVRRTHWYLPPFLFRYSLETRDYLARVKCQVHLIHGTSDDKISHESSLALKDRRDKLELPAELHLIENGEHNLRGKPTSQKFTEKLQEILLPTSVPRDQARK